MEPFKLLFGTLLLAIFLVMKLGFTVLTVSILLEEPPTGSFFSMERPLVELGTTSLALFCNEPDEGLIGPFVGIRGFTELRLVGGFGGLPTFGFILKFSFKYGISNQWQNPEFDIPMLEERSLTVGDAI